MTFMQWLGLIWPQLLSCAVIGVMSVYIVITVMWDDEDEE